MMSRMNHEYDIAIVKQISVDLTNEPGTLAVFAETLARSNVAIHGISVESGHGVSRVHFVVNNTEKAIEVLTEIGENVSVKEILAVTINERKGGEISRIARKLADEQVNIDVIYLTSAEKGSHPTVYLSASNMGVHAVKALLSTLH
ncbi:MAG: hypothetical protein RI911_116 [Candidatus Parcubacteria bacterium]|jgi:hypothetical protein